MNIEQQAAIYESWTLSQLAEEAIGAADAAVRNSRAAVVQAVNAGRLLIAAKAKVEHGQWKRWLEANWQSRGRSYETAKQYMRLANSGLNLSEIPSIREGLRMLAANEKGSATLFDDPAGKSTAAANLTGVDIPPVETPIATPNEEGAEATASARATKRERQSTVKAGSEPVEEETQTPERGNGPAASSADSRPKTSTSTLSGDSITDPPIVRWDQIGVDFPQIGQAFAAIVRLPMTDEERRKMVRLVETELLRKLKQLLPEDEKPKAAKRFKPPTLEQVREYCQERGNSVDPEAWIDFYTSKGWMVGKNKMKDWKAAVRTWEKSDRLDKSDLARVRGTDWSEYDD